MPTKFNPFKLLWYGFRTHHTNSRPFLKFWYNIRRQRTKWIQKFEARIFSGQIQI